MNRKHFISLAGGVHLSNKNYDDWNGRDRYEHFWGFFEGNNLSMPSIYQGISVRDLFDYDEFSIEHILPMGFIYRHMKSQNRKIRDGASTNPFNMAACHRDVNRARGNSPFDLDGDQVKLAYDLPYETKGEGQSGHDDDYEWVVPRRTRGDVARAVIYMCLIYEVGGFEPGDFLTLSEWALADKPSKWERAFCRWVDKHHGIRNPFISEDQHELLTDAELMRSLVHS